MRNIKRKIREIYDRNSSIWAEFNEIDDDLTREIKLYLGKDSFILDVGCGGGRLSVALSRYVGRIVAIDFSNEMISLAKKMYPILNVEYPIMDAEKMKFKAGQFDAVVSNMAINRASCRLDRVLEQSYLVLRSRGYVFLNVLSSKSSQKLGLDLGYNAGEIRRLLEDVDFTPLSIREHANITLGKSLDNLKFIERTEIGAILGERRIVRIYAEAERRKNYDFDETYVSIIAKKGRK